MNRYQSEDEIENVVRGFETCETGADDFHHSEHLAVAVWYLHHDGQGRSARSYARRLVAVFESSRGRHEASIARTITVFYIDRIAEKLNEIGPEVSIVEKCNAVLATDFRGLKTD